MPHARTIPGNELSNRGSKRFCGFASACNRLNDVAVRGPRPAAACGNQREFITQRGELREAVLDLS